ncbi:hypothetical protein F2P56_032720, partial [Juglans regia]
FNRCLDVCGLLELHSKGRKFSWSNGQEGHAISWARLDRAAINAHFLRDFPSMFLEYLSQKSLDRRPMCIQGSNVDRRYGAAPFHFQQMWVQHSSFLECVANSWKQPVSDRGLIKHMAKLKK